MFFFQFLVQAGVFFTIPLFLSVVLELSALQTGIRLLPLSVALLVAAVGIPKAAPRARPRLIVRLGAVPPPGSRTEYAVGTARSVHSSGGTREHPARIAEGLQSRATIDALHPFMINPAPNRRRSRPAGSPVGGGAWRGVAWWTGPGVITGRRQRESTCLT